MHSSNVPYLIAGSAIGGAIGYLAFTQSGRRTARSLRELCSDDRDRVRESIGEGRKAYEEAEAESCAQIVEIELGNRKVAASTHRMVDALHETVYSIEKSVLIPFFQSRSLVIAFRHGWRVLLRTDRSAPSATSAA